MVENDNKEVIYVPDTNALLNRPGFILKNPTVILDTVLGELTTLERKKDYKALQYQLREAKRTIMEGVEKGTVSVFDGMPTGADQTTVKDDTIIEQYEMLNELNPQNSYVLVTDDVLMKIKVEGREIAYESAYTIEEDNGYRIGVYEFFFDPAVGEHREILTKIEEVRNSGMEIVYNPFNLKTNQYVVVWDVSTESTNSEGEKVYDEAGTYRFNGKYLEWVRFKDINSSFEKFRPINVRQRLAFDLMQNPEIPVKLLTGEFGTGKDAVMIAHAIDLLKKHKKEKIVWVRNNIEVKDTNSIGYLPNELEDKLEPFIAPLIDKAGGREGYEQIRDRVDIQHLGFLRGREFKNSIIYVTEAQTTTRDHIKLILGRAGEGSEVWINGDTRQTDDKKFEYDNGINALLDLTGEPLFGHVEFDKVERSATANLASKLDR